MVVMHPPIPPAGEWNVVWSVHSCDPREREREGRFFWRRIWKFIREIKWFKGYRPEGGDGGREVAPLSESIKLGHVSGTLQGLRLYAFVVIVRTSVGLPALEDGGPRRDLIALRKFIFDGTPRYGIEMFWERPLVAGF